MCLEWSGIRKKIKTDFFIAFIYRASCAGHREPFFHSFARTLINLAVRDGPEIMTFMRNLDGWHG